MTRRQLLCLSLVQIARSQTHEKLPEFEAASVRYVGPYDSDLAPMRKGGPGTDDPERLRWENAPLLALISRAWGGIDFGLISGPSWLDSELYTVIAKIPPGANRDEVDLMLQRLLAGRFHLKSHSAFKNLPVYELVVARGGAKLKASAGSVGSRTPGAGRPTSDPEGFPSLPPGVHQAVFQPTVDGERVTRETFRDVSMAEFANNLAWPLGSPVWQHVISTARVLDKTGLTGRYDFKLAYAGTYYPGGAFPNLRSDSRGFAAPLLSEALQQQLGLALRETKVVTQILVIDSVDKVPTDN